MIEFALLFGLGFLSAALLAMLIAPAIHRRIVRYTENRLTATMPLTPQEVRAQKDMARAVFAAENSRTAEELIRTREKAMRLEIDNNRLIEIDREISTGYAGLKHDLETQTLRANGLELELAEQKAIAVAAVKKADEAQEQVALRERRLAELADEIHVLGSNLDNMRIDIAARDTQGESLRQRITNLRDERDGLRREVKLLTQRAREAEQRLEAEEHRVYRLEDRLAREKSASADKDMQLERRQAEIDSLRERGKGKGARRGRAEPEGAARTTQKTEGPETRTMAADQSSRDMMLNDMVAAVRSRANALTEKLAEARDAEDEAALREDIADLGARMVTLTAVSEGETSPIHAMIANAPPAQPGAPQSLAERVRDLLDPPTGKAHPAE